MKLTSRSEYGLLALIYLTRHYNDEYISKETIATAQSIPPKFLEQILLTLKRASYLHSLKGQHGGYRLAKPPEQITLAEIVRLFDGALAPTESVSKYFYHSTPMEKEPHLVEVFESIRNFVAEKLEHTTLIDVN